MNEQLQDDDLVKADLRDQERLEQERAPWESTYREIDELYPDGAGGFNKGTQGQIRGQDLHDITHLTALGRFAAAMSSITTPETEMYIRPRFLDPELNKLRSVQLWREAAGERLYGMRHALHTGFTTAVLEDWDQTGRYGTAPLWTDRIEGRGLFYKSLHLSSCYIDTDFAGLVNRVHRKKCKRVAELEEEFGRDSLTPKMQQALIDNKPNTEFEVLQIVAPNRSWDLDKFDWRRFPIGSRYLAIDEKMYIRRGGFRSMPISVSRHATSTEEKYGRSPAIRTAPPTMGLQAMQRTVHRAAHKAVDPALAFYNDDGITSIATRPGGLNPGLVDEQGRLMVARMPGGEAGLPYAENATERERKVIQTEFLEEFYKILTDPNSRMTTTEVLEVMGKQGVLVRPYATRWFMEKAHPVSQRELELALEAKQLPPLPPEVLEAGAWPVIEYENKLAEMARAESTAKTMRFVEALTPMAQLDGGQVYDYLDTDAMVPGLAAEIGVKPSYLRDPKDVAAIRAQRAQEKAVAVEAEQLKQVSEAYQNIAKGNQISEAA